ncbi:lipopolysaccharide biosynthesis protein [Flavobacterium luteolum]|uniref:lipopolysaccharide biosynthesis protein n=1 Tax=Flavobacterium luteolum TaxID=3003259 RepID=UPI00248E4A2A|nr:lipopolysaccharide biosynthesis protein [Flavobacterium luteolum]
MSLKKQVLSGFFWSFLQQFSTQLLTFLVQLIFARILLPSEFGLIGMLTVFIGIGTALFEGGMTSSLIRVSEVDTRDYSTVFFFNLGVSILIYLLFFLAAPYIALFYRQPMLSDIARIYGFSFVFLAFGTVQNTILTKEMKFKRQALITFPALLIGSILGIVFAYNGFGVWSLVYSMLTTNLLTSFFLWFSSDWRPQFVFDIDKFRLHFYFGYKMTLSSLLDTIFTNIYQIIIGRVYSPVLVGYYTRANSLMMLPVGNVSAVLNKIVFPLFAKVQDDISGLRAAYKKIMLIVLFIITPIIVLMALLADQLVVFLFTEKWLPIVPIFQIICLSGILYPLHLYNLMILQVKGRSDLFLRLEIIKKVIFVLIIVISIFFGFTSLMIGYVIASILALFINTHYAGSMIDYTMKQQLLDILPIFIISICMGVVVFFVNNNLIAYNNISRLIISSIVGIVIYISLAFIFKFQSINDVKNIMKK